MSYYDDFDPTPRRNKGGPLLFGIIGGVIGGLLVMMLMPLLGGDGMGLNDRGLDNNGERAPSSMDQRQVQTVKVNVTSGVEDAVEKVEKSIVGVVNLQQAQDFWSRKSEVIPAGTGSGVIFDRTDDTILIVTNHHVVEGASEVDVVLADGDRLRAEVRGTDPVTDLAVISIKTSKRDFTPVPFGDSDRLRAGEPAIAIGNPLGLDFSRSVTFGVISSTDRSIPQDFNGDGVSDWEMEVIQTDAAINPGNSGGALINIAGQLIGINSAKISQVGVEGMGFAIPINDARPIIQSLLENRTVKRPMIGIEPKDLQEVDSKYWSSTLELPPDVKTGVVVIDASGPAAGKLKELDVIVKLDDTTIRSSADLRKYLYTRKEVGDSITVTYYRDGNLDSVTFNLGEM